MHIHIIKPGVLTTIQDGGRYGHRSQGIAPGGVMDVFAAVMAQRLVLNPPGTAVMEMHYPAPELLFEADALLGIAGGDFDMHINGMPAANWKSHYIKAGAVVNFRGVKKGFRAYMAVHGGFALDAWLNSYATHAVSQLGGYKGRPLQKNDRLPLSLKAPAAPESFQSQIQPHTIATAYGSGATIACIQGPEFVWLSAESQQLLHDGKAVYRISAESNRMADWLTGPPLQLQPAMPQLLSSAVCFGAVQLLPGGTPLILMADHQSTGGYPRILSVTGAGIPKLAQMWPGTEIQLRLVSLQEAEDSLLRLWRMMEPVQTGG